MNDYLSHIGVGHDDDPPGRGSGRYGWGTGENPNQHQFDFLSEVTKLKKQGIGEAEIAKMLLGPKKKAVDLRASVSIAKNEIKKVKISEGLQMLDKCNGNMSEAARRLGMKNESSLRSLLSDSVKDRADRYQKTAEMLKEIVKEKGVIDVGKDAELYLNVPRYTLDVAISILENEGYLKSYRNIKQATTTHETTLKVLAPPGTTHYQIQTMPVDNIKGIETFTPDEGKTWWTPEFPTSLDSKRIMIRYAEDGGKEKDGVIELRRGVEDISLGASQYAQVRIAVDGTHYMKGMAIYADPADIPKGVDVIYNTNKHKGTPMIGPDKDHEVLKRLKIDGKTGEVDKENPFGALIKSPKDRNGVISAGGQRHYIDKDGKEKLSPINKLQDEGDWDSWSRNLSSQFLSKQSEKLIKDQLDLSIKSKKVELDEIKRLTNPVIKEKMLYDFARGCDANADDLAAQGVKKQSYQVILPVPSLKDNECYAPNFDDGEQLALIRYPHGGTFEIPVLKVNNKHQKAKSIMKDATDAIGINANVAERLSGADFDGDTVVAIPLTTNRMKVTSTPQLKGLKGFDGKELYKLPDDAPEMKERTKQREMGIVSNLITDMTVGGATQGEIERAVKHSMVVIDAKKHHLDYKQSAKDNNIDSLKDSYQKNLETGKSGGASTILSRAKSTTRVDDRKEVNDKNKMTPEEVERWNKGEIIYHPTGKTSLKLITDPDKMTSSELERYKSGRKIYRDTGTPKQIEVTKMSTVQDARELVRDPSNAKEMAYADFANELKSLANNARATARKIKPEKVSKSAQKTYEKEVERLNAALNIASRNNPRERQAQTIANALYSERYKSNPDWDHEHRQREQARCLTEARAMVGAKKERIVISDTEWEAIQANAISTNKLKKIIDNCDLDALKKRATPRTNDVSLTNNQIALIKSMSSSGRYTQKEIADRIGVSASTVSKALRNIA